MIFSSPTFLFFFLPICFLLYFIIPSTKAKNIILLIFSIVFYLFSSTHFIPILFSSILFNFFVAQLINHNKGSAKSYWIILGVTVNLAILFYYKYLGFFVDSLLNPLLTRTQITQITIPKIVIPLAISFYTFHALSYLLDVYKGKVRPAKRLRDLALYFLFFPHLIAGPIVRFKEIYAQIEKRSVSLTDFSYGVTRFISGLAKKVLIADTVGNLTDTIFTIPPANMDFTTAWLGVLSFTLQIYFDFSGYSDMAIGLASMFGFKFPENFNYPYISTSITEFWRRWHITLSSWVRDYLYYPLALNWGRKSKTKLYLSLMITFVLVGIWHGANWTFVVFGAIQGLAMIIERIRNETLINWMPKLLRHVYFLLVLSVSWVFFRADNLSYALAFLKRMFLNFSNPEIQFRSTIFFLNNERILAIIFGVLISAPIVQNLLYKSKNWLNGIPYQLIKLSYLTTIIYLSIIYVAGSTYHPFIYFKF